MRRGGGRRVFLLGKEQELRTDNAQGSSTAVVAQKRPVKWDGPDLPRFKVGGPGESKHGGLSGGHRMSEQARGEAARLLAG